MNIKKTLVILAIEDALTDMEKPILEQVFNRLYSKYRCFLHDCYENPEYLREVLQELYGNAHLDIIRSIYKNLEEHSTKQPISEFLTKLRTMSS